MREAVCAEEATHLRSTDGVVDVVCGGVVARRELLTQMEITVIGLMGGFYMFMILLAFTRFGAAAEYHTLLFSIKLL